MNNTKYKVGVADYGMNVWEGGCFSLERRLEAVKACGYDGIEMLRAGNAEEFFFRSGLFRRAGMEFLSCDASGDQELTCRAAAATKCPYVWLNCGKSTRDVPYEVWLRRAKLFMASAAGWGVKCAIHNHLGTVIESEAEIHRVMADCPDLLLLLDAGHLGAMEGDIPGVIRRYADRLAAVHLKDVLIKNPSIPMGAENWWERLEFREFGAGNIGMDIPGAVKALRDSGYTGWLLVEQDTHRREPALDLKANLEILRACL